MLLTAVVAAMSVWNAQADTYYLNAANSNDTKISESFTTTSGGAAQAGSTNLWKKFCNHSSIGTAYDGPHKLIIDQGRTPTNRILLDFNPLSVSSLEVTADANGTWIGNSGLRQYYIGDNTEGADAQTSTFEGNLKLQGTTVDFVGTQTWKIADGVLVTLDTTNNGDNKAAVTVTGALTLSGTESGAGTLSVRQTITNTNGTVALDGVAIAISTADVVNGNFGEWSLQSVTGGNANNGYVQFSDIKLFSDGSKVTTTPGTAYVSIDGTKFNSLETAHSAGYILTESETYSKTVMADAKQLIVQNSAILTLNESLSDTVTGGIVLQGTEATIDLGKAAVLNKSSVTAYSGNGKLTGTGTYNIGEITNHDKIHEPVNLSGFKGTVQANTGNGSFNLSKWSTLNSSAKLELSNFVGYLSGETLSTNLILKDVEEVSYALRLNNGSSTADKTATFSGSIEGKGDIAYVWATGTSNYSTTHVFTGDTSKWEGKFVRDVDGDGKITNVKFTSGGNVFHTNGTGGVQNKDAVAKMNVTIDAASATTFNGSIENVNTVTVNSNTTFKQDVEAVTLTLAADKTMGVDADISANQLTLGNNVALVFGGGSISVVNGLSVNASAISLADGYTFTTAEDYTLLSVGNGNTLEVIGWENWAGNGSIYNIGGVDYSAGLNLVDNSLKLTFKAQSIPEPTTATLSLLALAGLAARRRRK